MQLSVWSSYFYDLSPEKMVLAFAQKGWNYSELSDEHAAALLEKSDAEKTGLAFAGFAKEHGLSFTQGHLWLRCDLAAADREDIVEKLKRWLDLFLAVGIKAAVLHPAGPARYKAGDDAAAIMADSQLTLRRLTDYLKGTDMVICLENLYTHFSTAAELLQLIEPIAGANLGICLDTGHLNLAGHDQADFIRQSGQYLKALHIADNQGETDQHLLPYGLGTVDWPSVVAALHEIGYQGLFNFEIPGERRAPMPVLLAKLDYIKQMGQLMLARPD